MSSIYDWSVVAANNATSDSLINWVEGMPPSAVNNSARQVEARVAEILGDISGSLTAGGTSSALTVTANSAFTTYANGRMIAIKASVDNAASATLNVNGIGAKSIRKFTPTEAALAGAEMKNTGIYLLMYNTALNAAAGGWHLLTPTTDLASFVTLTGVQTLTNKTLTSPVFDGSPVVTSTDAGAGVGPVWDLYRDSASPAASDGLAQIQFNGRDSAGNKQSYGSILGVIVDPTSTSEDSLLAFYTTIAGANYQCSVMGAGFYVGSPTGADKGAGTINATAYYINGALIDYADLAKLSVADQVVTGGARVTSNSLGTISSGTVTPDPGDRPLQHYTNNGAHTLAPGSNTGSYLLDIVNGASAGAITTSGWTKVSGDSFTTTNTNKFRCSCSVGQQGSLLVVQALQ